MTGPALIFDPWMDAHEAAAYLRLSESRVRDLARSGELREDGRGASGSTLEVREKRGGR